VREMSITKPMRTLGNGKRAYMFLFGEYFAMLELWIGRVRIFYLTF